MFYIPLRLSVRNDFDESGYGGCNAKISIYNETKTIWSSDEVRTNIEIGQQAYGRYGTTWMVNHSLKKIFVNLTVKNYFLV